LNAKDLTNSMNPADRISTDTTADNDIRFRICSIELFERPVQLRLPFRFGVVTLTACPQAFVRLRIELPNGRSAIGAAAEMMAPKWFDKNLALSNDDNFDQLRDVCQMASDAYLSDPSPASAFGHCSRRYESHQRAALASGYNPLLANYGPALIDRAVLDALCRAESVSLDGNEQYESAEQVLELISRLRAHPALSRLRKSILFVEQPVSRSVALAADFRGNRLGLPVIIDESDAELDTFIIARGCGYAGVSSKTCKGLYKSILNAARCRLWNAEQIAAGSVQRFFMSAEDLTTQAGLAVQQDLALVNLLGIGHVERNGHHYVNGMAALPASEQSAFLAAHPDLYEQSQGAVRLTIRQGRIALGTLACDGYASAVMPDFSAMQPMRAVNSRNLSSRNPTSSAT
jgi:hypothetical protein